MTVVLRHGVSSKGVGLCSVRFKRIDDFTVMEAVTPNSDCNRVHGRGHVFSMANLICRTIHGRQTHIVKIMSCVVFTFDFQDSHDNVAVGTAESASTMVHLDMSRVLLVVVGAKATSLFQMLEFGSSIAWLRTDQQWDELRRAIVGNLVHQRKMAVSDGVGSERCVPNGIGCRGKQSPSIGSSEGSSGCVPCRISSKRGDSQSTKVGHTSCRRWMGGCRCHHCSTARGRIGRRRGRFRHGGVVDLVNAKAGSSELMKVDGFADCERVEMERIGGSKSWKRQQPKGTSSKPLSCVKTLNSCRVAADRNGQAKECREVRMAMKRHRR